MVVIDLPVAADRATLHDRAARPSMRTVQAPHWAMPQPYLVPVSFSESRSTHSNGVSGSTATLWAMPLTISEIDIAASPYAADCGFACARWPGTTRKNAIWVRLGGITRGRCSYLKLDAAATQGEAAGDNGRRRRFGF